MLSLARHESVAFYNRLKKDKFNVLVGMCSCGNRYLYWVATLTNIPSKTHCGRCSENIFSHMSSNWRHKERLGCGFACGLVWPGKNNA